MIRRFEKYPASNIPYETLRKGGSEIPFNQVEIDRAALRRRIFRCATLHLQSGALATARNRCRAFEESLRSDLQPLFPVFK